jgi:tetratricopeptide (TPR) repeat protein
MAKLVVEKTGNYGIMFFNKYTTMNKKPAGHPGATVFKIFLTLIFILLVVIILTPFIAELKFVAAQRLALKYLWKDAQQKFKSAMCIDPFDATLPAGFAGLLRNIGLNHFEKNIFLINSAKLYNRALELDPFNAEYSLRLAEIEITLFIQGQAKDSNTLNRAIDHLERASKNDPNGFNISYSVGYVGMLVWGHLNTSDKELILGRLKYILEAKPWYGEYIYSHLLKNTKDPGLVSKIRPRESFQKRMERIKHGNFSRSWQGKSKTGQNIYENGNMYWEGTIDTLLNVPEGECIIKIQAKGASADDIWPYMIVELDGQEIGETFVDSTEWKEYEFKIDRLERAAPSDSLKVLSVTFLNDGTNAKKHEDRNLYVGETRVIKNERPGI